MEQPWWVNLLFLLAGSLVSFIPQEISRVSAEKRAFEREQRRSEIEKLETLAGSLAATYSYVGTDDFHVVLPEISKDVARNRYVLYRYPDLEEIYGEFVMRVKQDDLAIQEIWERHSKGEISLEELYREHDEALKPLRELSRQFSERVSEITRRRTLD